MTFCMTIFAQTGKSGQNRIRYTADFAYSEGAPGTMTTAAPRGTPAAPHRLATRAEVR